MSKPDFEKNYNEIQRLKNSVLDMGTSSSNIDEINETEYRYTSDTTRTPNNENGYLYTQKMDDDYLIQKFTRYNGIQEWTRAKVAGKWGEWECTYNKYEKPQSGTLTLQNSWEAHAALTPQIVRNRNMLHISFCVKNGIGSIIGTLSEGYRPKSNMFVPASKYGGSGAVVMIQSDGNVVCENADIGALLTVNATLLAQ